MAVALSHTPRAHWARVISLYLGLVAGLGHVAVAVLGALGLVSTAPLSVSGLSMLGGSLVLVLAATLSRHRVEECVRCYARPTLGWAPYCLAGHMLWYTRWLSVLWVALAGVLVWGLVQLVVGEQLMAHLWLGVALAVTFGAFLAGDYHVRARAWCERCPSSERARGLVARTQAQQWLYRGTPRASVVNRADYY